MEMKKLYQSHHIHEKDTQIVNATKERRLVN